MNSRLTLRLLPFIGVLSLTGCLQDSASYAFPEKEHAITLVRNQPWFWMDTADIEVIAIRLPECNDGITLDAVPRDAELALYQAPDEYPEPIFILKTGKRHLAISTQSCRVQKFEEAPAELGEKLGEFVEMEGVFKFVANKAGGAAPAAAKEEE
jgi:hypothetical protein